MTLHIPEITDDMDTVAAALAYAEAGWYVLPVDLTKDGKHPGTVVYDGWPSKSSRDPQQIAAWFAGTDYGIALHCGRSGAIVFDVDDPNKLPEVMVQHLDSAPHQSSRPDSPGRGHYVFLQPPGRMIGNGMGRLGGSWGEVRGRNGVFIAAPTPHKVGGMYRWLRNNPIPVLPKEIGELLDDSSSAEDAASDAEVQTFLAEHQGDERPHVIHGWRAAWNKHMKAGHARHPSMVSVLTGAMKEARAGFFPASAAEHMLRELFIEAKTRDPINGETQLTAKQAHAAFSGILSWSVAQANNADLDQVRVRTAEKMPESVEEVGNISGQMTEESSDGTVKLKYVGHTAQLQFAYRLADLAKGQLLHVHGIGWHYWTGTCWTYDDKGMAFRTVYKLLKALWKHAFGDTDQAKELAKAISRCETANGVAGILTLARALPEFAVTVRDLDADPYLLNCANGTLDLRTMELRDHDAADRITMVTRAAYDPDAAAATWNRFLARVLPDEDVRAYLQRVTGVGLLGKVAEHILAILTGTGANGKGTFYKAVLWALGDYGSTVEPDLLMHRQGAHPTGEMDLLGRRLIVVSESERDRRLAEATMKRLTGGDTIRARRMHKDFIEFEPSHTPLLITNHLPKVAGDDPAIWRRLRLVPFTVEIPPSERDPYLDEGLQIEADAVLAWALAGWADYRRGGLAEPQAVLVATGDYQKSSDAVARFIEECCVTSSPVLQATTAQLFAEWERWRVNDGAEPLSLKAFGRAITNKGYPASAPSNGKKWRKGIALAVTEGARDDTE